MLKGVATRLAVMEKCISGATTKCCSRKISELDCFNIDLRWKRTGPSEHSFGSLAYIGGREYVVLQDSFSLAMVGIYKLSSTSQCNMPVEPAKTHFQRTELAT